MEEIKIRYHADIDELEFVGGKERSNWIDLRSAETIHMEPGDFRMISLGVSMKLPEGYEAIVAPRSSTFKKFGIILINSIGIIDGSYCGDNDVWRFPALCMRETTIHKNDRIAQFRIIRNQPDIHFNVVEHLDGDDRGGFGSTGVK